MHYLKRLNKLLGLVNLGLVITLIVVIDPILTPEHQTREEMGLSWQDSTTIPSHVVGDTETKYGDPAIILQRDMFGMGQGEVQKRGPTLKSKAMEPRPRVKQPVPFKLIGTVASEEGDSYAILEDIETQTQDIYRVGATIGNASIDSIEQNRVVVLNMGSREVLDLVLAGRGAPSSRAVAKAEVPAGQMSPDKVVRVIANGDRQVNTRVAPSKLNGAAYSLLSKMELTPHVVDGEAKGLRVSGLKDSVMAQLAGIRDGDVLQSVNGQSVTNRRKALQVLKKARKLGSARLELSRGQEKKSLAFHTGAW